MIPAAISHVQESFFRAVNTDIEMESTSTHPCHRLSIPAARLFWCRHCMQIFEDPITRWRHSKTCLQSSSGKVRKDRDGSTMQVFLAANDLSMLRREQNRSQSFNQSIRLGQSPGTDLRCFICKTTFVSIDEMRAHVRTPCRKRESLAAPKHKFSALPVEVKPQIQVPNTTSEIIYIRDGHHTVISLESPYTTEIIAPVPEDQIPAVEMVLPGASKSEVDSKNWNENKENNIRKRKRVLFPKEVDDRQNRKTSNSPKSDSEITLSSPPTKSDDPKEILNDLEAPPIKISKMTNKDPEDETSPVKIRAKLLQTREELCQLVSAEKNDNQMFPEGEHVSNRVVTEFIPSEVDLFDNPDSPVEKIVTGAAAEAKLKDLFSTIDIQNKAKLSSSLKQAKSARTSPKSPCKAGSPPNIRKDNINCRNDNRKKVQRRLSLAKEDKVDTSGLLLYMPPINAGSVTLHDPLLDLRSGLPAEMLLDETTNMKPAPIHPALEAINQFCPSDIMEETKLPSHIFDGDLLPSHMHSEVLFEEILDEKGNSPVEGLITGEIDLEEGVNIKSPVGVDKVEEEIKKETPVVEVLSVNEAVSTERVTPIKENAQIFASLEEIPLSDTVDHVEEIAHTTIVTPIKEIPVTIKETVENTIPVETLTSVLKTTSIKTLQSVEEATAVQATLTESVPLGKKTTPTEAITPIVEPIPTEAVPQVLEPISTEAVLPVLKPIHINAVAVQETPEVAMAALERASSEVATAAQEPASPEAATVTLEPVSPEVANAAQEPASPEAATVTLEPVSPDVANEPLEPTPPEASASLEPKSTDTTSLEPMLLKADTATLELVSPPEAATAVLEPETPEAATAAMEAETPEVATAAMEAETPEAATAAMEAETPEAATAAMEAETPEAVTAAMEAETPEVATATMEPEIPEAATATIEPETAALETTTVETALPVKDAALTEIKTDAVTSSVKAIRETSEILEESELEQVNGKEPLVPVAKSLELSIRPSEPVPAAKNSEEEADKDEEESSLIEKSEEKTKNKSVKLFKCKACSNTFKTSQALQKHSRIPCKVKHTRSLSQKILRPKQPCMKIEKKPIKKKMVRPQRRPKFMVPIIPITRSELIRPTVPRRPKRFSRRKRKKSFFVDEQNRILPFVNVLMSELSDKDRFFYKLGMINQFRKIPASSEMTTVPNGETPTVETLGDSLLEESSSNVESPDIKTDPTYPKVVAAELQGIAFSASPAVTAAAAATSCVSDRENPPAPATGPCLSLPTLEKMEDDQFHNPNPIPPILAKAELPNPNTDRPSDGTTVLSTVQSPCWEAAPRLAQLPGVTQIVRVTSADPSNGINTADKPSVTPESDQSKVLVNGKSLSFSNSSPQSKIMSKETVNDSNLNISDCHLAAKTLAVKCEKTKELNSKETVFENGASLPKKLSAPLQKESKKEQSRSDVAQNDQRNLTDKKMERNSDSKAKICKIKQRTNSEGENPKQLKKSKIISPENMDQSNNKNLVKSKHNHSFTAKNDVIKPVNQCKNQSRTNAKNEKGANSCNGANIEKGAKKPQSVGSDISNSQKRTPSSLSKSDTALSSKKVTPDRKSSCKKAASNQEPHLPSTLSKQCSVSLRSVSNEVDLTNYQNKNSSISTRSSPMRNAANNQALEIQKTPNSSVKKQKKETKCQNEDKGIGKSVTKSLQSKEKNSSPASSNSQQKSKNATPNEKSNGKNCRAVPSKNHSSDALSLSSEKESTPSEESSLQKTAKQSKEPKKCDPVSETLAVANPSRVTRRSLKFQDSQADCKDSPKAVTPAENHDKSLSASKGSNSHQKEKSKVSQSASRTTRNGLDDAKHDSLSEKKKIEKADESEDQSHISQTVAPTSETKHRKNKSLGRNPTPIKQQKLDSPSTDRSNTSSIPNLRTRSISKTDSDPLISESSTNSTYSMSSRSKSKLSSESVDHPASPNKLSLLDKNISSTPTYHNTKSSSPVTKSSLSRSGGKRCNKMNTVSDSVTELPNEPNLKNKKLKEDIKPSSITGECHSESSPVLDERRSKSSPVLDERRSKSSPVLDEHRSKSSPVLDEHRSKSSEVSSERCSESSVVSNECHSESSPLSGECHSENTLVSSECHSEDPVTELLPEKSLQNSGPSDPPKTDAITVANVTATAGTLTSSPITNNEVATNSSSEAKTPVENSETSSIETLNPRVSIATQTDSSYLKETGSCDNTEKKEPPAPSSDPAPRPSSPATNTTPTPIPIPSNDIPSSVVLSEEEMSENKHLDPSATLPSPAEIVINDTHLSSISPSLGAISDFVQGLGVVQEDTETSIVQQESVLIPTNDPSCHQLVVDNMTDPNILVQYLSSLDPSLLTQDVTFVIIQGTPDEVAPLTDNHNFIIEQTANSVHTEQESANSQLIYTLQPPQLDTLQPPQLDTLQPTQMDITTEAEVVITNS